MSKSISKAELPGNTDDNLNNTIAPWQRLTYHAFLSVPDEILRRNSVISRSTRGFVAPHAFFSSWVEGPRDPDRHSCQRKADER